MPPSWLLRIVGATPNASKPSTRRFAPLCVIVPALFNVELLRTVCPPLPEMVRLASELLVKLPTLPPVQTKLPMLMTLFTLPPANCTLLPQTKPSVVGPAAEPFRLPALITRFDPPFKFDSIAHGPAVTFAPLICNVPVPFVVTGPCIANEPLLSCAIPLLANRNPLPEFSWPPPLN